MENNGLCGLTNINIELSNRCNKNCWMCGRRKVERDFPELALNYGDMDFNLIEKIAKQLPANIMVQLHNNGEALLYPRLGDAIRLFHRQITNIVTNGKLLVQKSEEIIDNLDTMAISIFEKDDEAEEQYGIVRKFLEIKGDRKPFTIFRLNGEVNGDKYKKLGIICRRILHSPMGSFNYHKKKPTIPEVGMCLDFLNHLAIDRDGKASICVRFDPKGLGVIGDCSTQPLEEIWNCKLRMKWLESHKRGKRSDVPLCSYCEFWGVPTGFDYD